MQKPKSFEDKHTKLKISRHSTYVILIFRRPFMLLVDDTNDLL